MNDGNSRQYYDDEIDLRQLFKSLKEHSRFIFGFTGVVTLLAIGYVLFFSPPSQYKVETSFFKPTKSSVTKLNQYSLLDETTNTANTANTAESIFNEFLTTLNSKVLQREVFIDGGYREKLGREGAPSISITKNKESVLTGVALPHILSTQSSNPDVVTEFLNEVLTVADKKTVNSLINVQKLKISNRLNKITTERQLLLTKAKQDRLSQIKRIKENDNQKLQEINNKIHATRFIAKTERMNEIVTLKDAAQLAATLGIIDNNLSLFNKSSSNLNIAIQSGTNIPDWYLYGETALLKMIESLKARENDDAYIPELAIFDTQIKDISDNPLLQTLEERLDDSPFTNEISQLDIETMQLKSIRPDLAGINAMQLYQSSNSEIIPSKNRLIIALAFIGSFMLSLVLVFLMNAFKEEDVTSIQKSK